MPEPLLQREFAHAALPHAGGMRMPQSVWGHPCLTDSSTFTDPREQPYKSVVTEGLASSPASTANKKDQRRLGLDRSLGQHVSAQSGQRLWLVQVDDAFDTRLRTYALRVVGPMAYDDPTASVSK